MPDYCSSEAALLANPAAACRVGWKVSFPRRASTQGFFTSFRFCQALSGPDVASNYPEPFDSFNAPFISPLHDIAPCVGADAWSSRRKCHECASHFICLRGRSKVCQWRKRGPFGRPYQKTDNLARKQPPYHQAICQSSFPGVSCNRLSTHKLTDPTTCTTPQ